MCRELDALRQSICSFAAGFDPHGLIPSQAAEVVRACARMEASISSVKAMAAARAGQGNDWKLGGYRSAADQLAQETGMSAAHARRTLEAGRRMADQPEVAAAAAAGELSPEQAAAVSDAVAAAPGRARDLIDFARRNSIPELQEEVARTRAAALDQEGRGAAIHRRRSLRRWPGRDGTFEAHMTGHSEDGVVVWRMLDPVRRCLNAARRAATPALTESFDALDYDALVAIANLATGGSSDLTLSDLVGLGLFPGLVAAAPPGASGGPCPASAGPPLPSLFDPPPGSGLPATPSSGGSSAVLSDPPPGSGSPPGSAFPPGSGPPPGSGSPPG